MIDNNEQSRCLTELKKMKCKNCGEDIIRCSNKWYHVENSRWLCSTKKAEPSETPSKIKGVKNE